MRCAGGIGCARQPPEELYLQRAHYHRRRFKRDELCCTRHDWRPKGSANFSIIESGAVQ
jgi:hypothetical protein